METAGTLVVQVFWFLLAAGVLMLCAEVFVPGGVLGLIGCLALVAAAAASFRAFPGRGPFVAMAIVVGSGLALILWVRLFPNTPLGRRMTLRAQASDGRLQAARDKELIGKEGVAQTDLRPSGIALIEGRRTDVLTEGQMVGKGERVRVVERRGIGIVVRRMESKEERAS